MSYYKVLGIERKKGEYNGRNYDNKVLYCQYPDSYKQENLEGIKIEIVKVSSTLPAAATVLVGDEIDVRYNKYGQVEDILAV